MRTLGRNGQCRICDRNENLNRAASATGVAVCLVRGLYGPLLVKAFNSITAQQEMIEFQNEMETWYSNETL